MAKHTKGKGKSGKLGAPDHFVGSKLAFLLSKGTVYQQAIDSKTVTAFYDKVTLDFVEKFGLETPFNLEPERESTDFEDDPQPEADDAVDGSTLTRLSNEELAEQPALFVKLRTVS
jgi:hypothetical protein